ncbi:hypothetical protein SCHPADRAFT_492703 [Schizopora paradoxa]|uniref:BTB domain-containing protein n=1 Tax=Schizopora paradoxa TaxID=27342 RepID=A0A0H2RGK6_9AGAM|nr:hypothetical protein SCHPADRAFT_492703 [Schizopora paradoxa]
MSTSLPAVFHATYAFEDGDVVLVSSDNIQFLVHSVVLREASPVFRDMTTIPGPREAEKQPSDRTIKLDEPAFVMEFLMDAIYPRETFPSVLNYNQAWEIARAADKYDIGRAFTILRSTILHNEELRGQTFRLYKLARRYQWTDIIAFSSKASLDKPLLNLRYMEPEALEHFFELSSEDAEDLLRLHRSRCAEILDFNVNNLTEYFFAEDVVTEDGEPKLAMYWGCGNGCGGTSDEVTDAAFTSFKNGLEKYLDREPAASALFERKAFDELFKELVRISAFKLANCRKCKRPFMNGEKAWEYFQGVASRIPSTVLEIVQPVET